MVLVIISIEACFPSHPIVGVCAVWDVGYEYERFCSWFNVICKHEANHAAEGIDVLAKEIYFRYR